MAHSGLSPFQACALLAGNSSASGATTFMQSLLKFASKTSKNVQQQNACAELDKHVSTLRALFSLLGNLALSAECRGIMWKVGLTWLVMETRSTILTFLMCCDHLS